MKTCIWCLRTEEEVDFIRLAHTIPQSLGGIFICKNVCDGCNSMFGRHDFKSPPIEVVLKEILNIPRITILSALKEVGKNKAISKINSEYFNINIEKKTILLKPRFQLTKNFLDIIFRQFKRGIYKVYLEELERETGTGLNPRYNFIRQFARFNVGDLPLYYFNRRYGIITASAEHIKSPRLHFDEDYRYKYLLQNESFYEFEILGHVFGISTSQLSHMVEEHYVQESLKLKEKFFNNCIRTNAISDIDVFQKFMR